MSEKMTYNEFCNKIEWEGGVIGGLEYGLRISDLDDEGKANYPDFCRLWSELEALDLERIVDYLQDHVDEEVEEQ